MRPSFDQIYMGLARALALRSTWARLKVGCVITSEDYRHVYGIGYNGNAVGASNACDSPTPGSCGCFTPGTKVNASAVSRAYRRRYFGEVITITTRSNQFTVTPNHPILTAGVGFKAAGLLSEGDYLVHASRAQDVFSGTPNDYNSVAIEEVFSALSITGRLVRSAGASHQFHGDGVVNQNVDIVVSDSLLCDCGLGIGCQCCSQPMFPAANVKLPMLCIDGAQVSASVSVGLRQQPEFQQSVTNYDNADPKLISQRLCRCSVCVSLFKPGTIDREHRLALIPVQVLSRLAENSSFTQTMLNDGMTDPNTSGQSEHLFSGQIALDKILHVKRDFWSGHVYNLQTKNGWYTVGETNVVVKNCLHAEENAIINCSNAWGKKRVYVTVSPCMMCAKRLINLRNVIEVVYGEQYRLNAGVQMLVQSGINTRQHLHIPNAMAR